MPSPNFSGVIIKILTFFEFQFNVFDTFKTKFCSKSGFVNNYYRLTIPHKDST